MLHILNHISKDYQCNKQEPIVHSDLYQTQPRNLCFTITVLGFHKQNNLVNPTRYTNQLLLQNPQVSLESRNVLFKICEQ